MEIVVTSIPVDDQQKALEFYTAKLGFVKKEDVPVGVHRWLTVVGPQNPTGTEALLEPIGMPEVADELRAYRKALVSAGIPWTSFACDDVAAEFERLRGLGVEFTQPPMDAGPATVAVFDDTCGNLIQIAQQHEGAGP